MSFDENTQTMSVGSRDWLEASKDMQIRSYLPPMGNVKITGESVEHNPRTNRTLITVRTSTDSQREGLEVPNNPLDPLKSLPENRLDVQGVYRLYEHTDVVTEHLPQSFVNLSVIALGLNRVAIIVKRGPGEMGNTPTRK